MTEFSLFIIESLDFEDESEDRFEGRILRDIFRLSGLAADYIYIRTQKELEEALRRFWESRKRYLHISSHGNERNIGLTLDSVPFQEFALAARPYLGKRRLFMSACAVVNNDLARAMLRGTGCYSLIGPRKKIRFDDAALMWASFYHLMFRDEGSSMKDSDIRNALRKVHATFGFSFDYFKGAPSKKGFVKVDLGKAGQG